MKYTDIVRLFKTAAKEPNPDAEPITAQDIIVGGAGVGAISGGLFGKSMAGAFPELTPLQRLSLIVLSSAVGGGAGAYVGKRISKLETPAILDNPITVSLFG